MKMVKKVGLVLLAIIVVIQFIRPSKNANASSGANDIANMYPMPDSVKLILAKACMDCHSDNTRYPWYNNIQPVAWWLNDHITDGKRELNFSEFGTYKLLKQAKKLRKSVKELQEGEMPLDSYTWIHKDAVLSDAEKQTYIHWASALSDQLYAKVPPEEIEADKKRQAEKKRMKG
jgi:Haem-binding domain